MKKSKSSIMIALPAMVFASAAYALIRPNTFQEAYREGARARVEFKVLDDTGIPVEGARVNVFFDMADRSKGRREIVSTDTNGMCVVEGKTKGVLEIEVSREGYYRSTDLISFIDMGREHEVNNGKWQPWGMVKQITLLPVKNPAAQIAATPDWKWTARASFQCNTERFRLERLAC